ncbi:3-oxoacyl-[acyl-carrier-protein] reductase FabG [compost metagenome]
MTKTVLITGCSTGLGNTTAKKFADEGWNVVATMRKPDGHLTAEYPEQLIEAALDVTDPASIEATIVAGIERFGRIDAVVNNAGISVAAIFEATPMEVARQIFETNVFGVMNVIKAITPHFHKHGGGTIVNISSSIGYAPAPLLAVYSATKHAVEGLSESLSYELESQNIAIKLVEPGYMRTTNFSASSTATLNIPIPPSYQSYFDQLMQNMINYPFDFADENWVAEQVYVATCDQSDRLRFVAGPDAEEMARLRWTETEETYLSAMRGLMGHMTWRESLEK